MKVYSPWEDPKTVMHDGQTYELSADADTELSDHVAAHAVRKLGETGVSALTGDEEMDASIRLVAEETHQAFLLRKAEAIGLDVAPRQHPDAPKILKGLAALAARAAKRAAAIVEFVESVKEDVSK